MPGRRSTSMVIKALPNPEIEAQERAVEQFMRSGGDFSLVVAGAFLRGIRDIGYKSNGFALNELVDNGIQAGAEAVLVLFGYGASPKKPDRIAVVDNGTGMTADMLHLA